MDIMFTSYEYGPENQDEALNRTASYVCAEILLKFPSVLRKLHLIVTMKD